MNKALIALGAMLLTQQVVAGTATPLGMPVPATGRYVVSLEVCKRAADDLGESKCAWSRSHKFSMHSQTHAVVNAEQAIPYMGRTDVLIRREGLYDGKALHLAGMPEVLLAQPSVGSTKSLIALEAYQVEMKPLTASGGKVKFQYGATLREIDRWLTSETGGNFRQPLMASTKLFGTIDLKPAEPVVLRRGRFDFKYVLH